MSKFKILSADGGGARLRGAYTVAPCDSCTITAKALDLTLKWFALGRSSMQPSTGNVVRAISLAAISILGAASAVFATPPTPPAQLQIENEAALSRLQVREGAFHVAVRVTRSREVSQLGIRVRILTTDPLQPTEVSNQTVQVPMDAPGEVLITIPLLKADGIYRVDIELTRVIDNREGVLDRKVFYQRIDGDRRELMLPEHLRSNEQRLRGALFQKRLREYPSRPDVKLLAPGTASVPPKIAEGIKPLSDRPQLVVRANGPSAAVRRHTVDSSNKAWGDVDPITVRGQLMYRDFEGTWRPLVNVSVNVYDDDTFGDEHLGTTTTDWNGNWSFSVNNDDGWLQNGRDIYYQFHLGNTRWDVHDDDGDDYLWQSATRDDVSDGAVVDYGTETGSTDATAMQVFAIINLGWNHITASGGQDPGYIEVKHPTAKTNHTAGVVNVTGGDNDGPDSILHEYGHALMYRAFGNTSISPGGSHGFDDDLQDPGLAYSEGWATGFMLSLCPDGAYNWHEGSTEGAGEWPTCTSQSDPGRAIELFSNGDNRVGERNEGRVAAAINDFRDSPNDANGNNENLGRNGESDANSSNRITLATIYRDSMWGFSHADFLDFWFTFAGNLSGASRTLADNIMQYNWMSLPVDISCVASKIVASQSAQSESLLAGLRAFRDQALKPTANGRRWIQVYYSHSPELAMLLIGDTQARHEALGVIEHFSRLGSSFTHRAEIEKLIDANQAVLPNNVSTSIESILGLLEQRSSPELRRELPALRQELATLRAISLKDLLYRAERDHLGDKDKPQYVVRPRALAPASAKADWDLIRRHLPREEGATKAPQAR